MPTKAYRAPPNQRYTASRIKHQRFALAIRPRVRRCQLCLAIKSRHRHTHGRRFTRTCIRHYSVLSYIRKLFPPPPLSRPPPTLARHRRRFTRTCVRPPQRAQLLYIGIACSAPVYWHSGLSCILGSTRVRILPIQTVAHSPAAVYLAGGGPPQAQVHTILYSPDGRRLYRCGLHSRRAARASARARTSARAHTHTRNMREERGEADVGRGRK